MPNAFLTNYTETTFLDRIKDNLRHCKSFAFSVSFIKKAGLILLYKDIEAAVERGCKGRIITSTYQNFTDIESLSDETREDILDYLRDCPLYELLSVGDKDYLLVHSGIENFDKNKKLSEYADDEFLWARPRLDERYFDELITVLGHTPTAYYGEEYTDKIVVTDTWIDIDMGAGSGHEPVLLRLDDMKEFRLG
ncbi:MAG: hypothetical protein IKO15_02045 [Clostridiales bacterium]|nr:hypothetical protein [Clostridiales bacterium]